MLTFKDEFKIKYPFKTMSERVLIVNELGYYFTKVLEITIRCISLVPS